MTDFQIGDSVWIKPLKKEGVVVAWHRYSENKVDYTVACKDLESGWDNHMVCSEFLGPKQSLFSIQEQDLELSPLKVNVLSTDSPEQVKEKVVAAYVKESEDNMLDALRYISSPGPIIHLFKKLRPEDILTGPKSCQHSYKRYEGFTNSYDYCEKCDHKKV